MDGFRTVLADYLGPSPPPHSLLPFWLIQLPHDGLGMCVRHPQPLRLNGVGFSICFTLAQEEGSLRVIMGRLSPSEPGT